MRLYVHVEGNVKYTGTAAAMDDDDTGTFTFTCCFRHTYCSWTGLDWTGVKASLRHSLSLLRC